MHNINKPIIEIPIAERLGTYKKMREYLDNKNRVYSGLCNALYMVIESTTTKVGRHLIQNYPELMSAMPLWKKWKFGEKRVGSFYWWELTESNRQRRVRILTRIIKRLERVV